MSITVRIGRPLRQLLGGNTEVEAEGATVAELLENLDAAYPGIRDLIVDGQGRKRREFNLYVHDEDIRDLGHMQTPLAAGDVISIVPAIVGGP